MDNLYDPTVLRSILDRITTLTASSARQWGKMDQAQMLAHCQAPLEIAVGKRHHKRGLVGFLFGGMARRKLLKPEPFGRNMPTAPFFKVTDARQLEPERERLLALVQEFHDRGPEGVAPEHPFFGKLTPAEWSALQWKHLDHHLRQFEA